MHNGEHSPTLCAVTESESRYDPTRIYSQGPRFATSSRISVWYTIPPTVPRSRVLDTPPRHLRAVERAFRKQPVPVAELAHYAQKRGGPPAREAVDTLLALLKDLHGAAENQSPVHVLENVLECTGYAVWLAAQR